jgi:hypothetical protein
MPWIKFLEEPTHMPEWAVDAYHNGDSLDLRVLENLENPLTKSMCNPPLVKPADKKTDDWKPDEIGEILCYTGNSGGVTYYKFIIIEPPINMSREEIMNTH